MNRSSFVFVAALLAAAGSAQAVSTLYVGFTGAGPALGETFPDAATARAAFLAQVQTPYLVETFSDNPALPPVDETQLGGVLVPGGVDVITFSPDTALNTVVAPPTGTVVGTGTERYFLGPATNWGDFQNLEIDDPFGVDLVGNPTRIDDNVWLGFNGALTINVVPGQHAIGFLLNDPAHPSAREITLNWSDGTSTTIGSSTTRLQNNGVYFIGAINRDATISSVVINSASVTDGLGLDDIIVANVIPTPSAVFGGAALMSILGLVRSRRR